MKLNINFNGRGRKIAESIPEGMTDSIVADIINRTSASKIVSAKLNAAGEYEIYVAGKYNDLISAYASSFGWYAIKAILEAAGRPVSGMPSNDFN